MCTHIRVTTKTLEIQYLPNQFIKSIKPSPGLVVQLVEAPSPTPKCYGFDSDQVTN